MKRRIKSLDGLEAIQTDCLLEATLIEIVKELAGQTIEENCYIPESCYEEGYVWTVCVDLSCSLAQAHKVCEKWKSWNLISHNPYWHRLKVTLLAGRAFNENGHLTKMGIS